MFLEKYPLCFKLLHLLLDRYDYDHDDQVDHVNPVNNLTKYTLFTYVENVGFVNHTDLINHDNYFYHVDLVHGEQWPRDFKIFPKKIPHQQKAMN